MRARLAWGVVLVAAAIAPLALLTVPTGIARPPRSGALAPDIAGGPWINGPSLTLAALRGRVVAVEFWTYG